MSLKPGHAGIGLSLVANAVRAPMGAVEAEGEGDEQTTTFRVSIPSSESRG